MSRSGAWTSEKYLETTSEATAEGCSSQNGQEGNDAMWAVDGCSIAQLSLDI